MMVSESHVAPDTLAKIPVIGFTLRLAEVSWKISLRDCPTSPVIIADLAASRFGSPMKAETLIFPAGTVNENCPFSSASAYPIGTQYVLSSPSTTWPSASATSSPLNASLSNITLALGIAPKPSSSTVPSRVAPL